MATNTNTALDFVTLAAKEAGILGVGQTLLAQDENDIFTLLQRMLNMWQRNRWIVLGLQTIGMPGNNAVSNTIGVGGYWNTVRPDKIQGAYFYQLNTGQTPVSLQLSSCFSYEDYIRITLKNLNSLPEAFFYDAQANPTGTNGALLGNVYIWPIPSPIYQIVLLIKTQLNSFATLDSAFQLPPEYEEAIHYNLAVRICSMYKIAASPDTAKLAKAALNTIKVNNTQIPELQMPPMLRQGKAFSIWNPDGY